MYRLRKIWNPSLYQGKHKKRSYFEGWYFKLISSDQQQVLSVIPGVSFGKKGEDNHAFIQVIDGISCKTHYVRYPLEALHISDQVFEVSLEDNFFSSSMIQLSIFDTAIQLHGTLTFNHSVPFPSSFFNPGIMGPFSFIPFMECYHGIVSVHHEINGSLTYNKLGRSFNQGYGYIEKDWGRSFPEAWIWLQCSHFTHKDVTVMFSMAKIPWLGRSFVGHIAFLRMGDRFYRFATYTGADITHLNIEAQSLSVTLQDRRHSLEINARSNGSGTLKAPKNGLMNREILESINADLTITFKDAQGNILLKDVGKRAGYEQVGAEIFQPTKNE